MKKIIILLCMIFILTISLIPVSAINKNNQSNERYNIETIITVESSSRSSGTITGKKTNNYKKGNTIIFTVSVTGTFTYDGSHSVCTNAIVSASSKNTNWKITSKNASKSGNCAIGNATAKRYDNGVVVETQKCSVALSCNANGNLY